MLIKWKPNIYLYILCALFCFRTSLQAMMENVPTLIENVPTLEHLASSKLLEIFKQADFETLQAYSDYFRSIEVPSRIIQHLLSKSPQIFTTFFMEAFPDLGTFFPNIAQVQLIADGKLLISNSQDLFRIELSPSGPKIQHLYKATINFRSRSQISIDGGFIALHDGLEFIIVDTADLSTRVIANDSSEFEFAPLNITSNFAYLGVRNQDKRVNYSDQSYHALNIYNLSDLSHITCESFNLPEQSCRSIFISNDDRFILLDSYPAGVILVDRHNNNKRYDLNDSYEGNYNGIDQVGFSSSAQYACIYRAKTNCITVFDLSNLKNITSKNITLPSSSSIQYIDFSPNSSKLYIHRDRYICIIDVASMSMEKVIYCSSPTGIRQVNSMGLLLNNSWKDTQSLLNLHTGIYYACNNIRCCRDKYGYSLLPDGAFAITDLQPTLTISELILLLRLSAYVSDNKGAQELLAHPFFAGIFNSIQDMALKEKINKLFNINLAQSSSV